MLRRRFMKQMVGSSGYTFSFVANFENNSTKNILEVNQQTYDTSLITKYGIGFTICIPFSSYTSSAAPYSIKMVNPISETENNATITIKVTTPNQQTYTTVIENALAGSAAGGIMAYGYSLATSFLIVYDNTATSDINYNTTSTSCVAEVNSLGATNYVLSATSNVSNKIYLICIGTSSNNLSLTPANSKRSCVSNLADGDYTFEVTISGIELESAIVYNYGVDTQAASGKNYHYSYCANRSKKEWIGGNSIFTDNMYKADGNI